MALARTRGARKIYAEGCGEDAGLEVGDDLCPTDIERRRFMDDAPLATFEGAFARGIGGTFVARVFGFIGCRTAVNRLRFCLWGLHFATEARGRLSERDEEEHGREQCRKEATR